MSSAPQVVLSLDFELRWGLHDVLGDDRDAYRANLEGVREAVPRLLALFTERGVRATWATVGALACSGWDEYFRRAPKPPAYLDGRLAFDPRWADWDPDGVLHFAPELVDAVAKTPGQELGSHTFSHVYFGEPGLMARDVAADAAAVAALFEERGWTRPRSFVFPRNQVGFTRELAREGVRTIRGNPKTWYWDRTRSHEESSLVRAMRLADSFNVLAHRAARPQHDAGIVSIPASIFLRLNGPDLVFDAVLARIAREAARLEPGDVLDLWFHLHNEGANVERSLERLERTFEAIDRHAPGAWQALRHNGRLRRRPRRLRRKLSPGRLQVSTRSGPTRRSLYSTRRSRPPTHHNAPNETAVAPTSATTPMAPSGASCVVTRVIPNATGAKRSLGTERGIVNIHCVAT